MFSSLTAWRRFGFWVGPSLLLGSLLLGGVLLLVAGFVFPLALFLLPVPAVGLVGGVVLNMSGTQPPWAELLALSPVLGPLLLLLLQVATWLPPPQNHLVFLVPVGYRGQVTVSQNKLVMEPTPRVNGQLLLEPPRYNGHLDIREPLAAADLRTAEYYAVAASGERLYRLPQLTEQAFAPAGRRGLPGGPAVSPRQVGVFPVGPPPVRPDADPSPLGAFFRRLTTNPYDRVGRLAFTVACYDSLAIQRQWYKW